MYKLFLILFGFSTLMGQSLAVLEGKITESERGLSLPGCNIIIENTGSGTVSDSAGQYSIKLREGSYILKFSYIGYQSVTRRIELSPKEYKSLDIVMKPEILQEKVVTVLGDKTDNSIVAKKIERKNIRQMPTVYNDVIRSVKILPGVTSNNELSSGYNVRGGNFHENLLYLNGFEIYRPFLLREGVEENQTLVNPDMVSALEFYNGTFAADFGDKLSSALVLDYGQGETDQIKGNLRADFLNAGATANYRKDNFGIIAGARYSYPGMFLNELHTSGSYKPEFADIQVALNYDLDKKNRLEFLFIHAYNKFDLKPEEWTGHFKSDRGGEYNAVAITYDGYRDYIYNTTLAGARYRHYFSDKSDLSFDFSWYSSGEEEKNDLRSDIFYDPDASQPGAGREFLKSATEVVDNLFDLEAFRTNLRFNIQFGNHLLKSGVEYDYYNLSDRVDEYFSESANENLIRVPRIIQKESLLNPYSFSVYLVDKYQINENILLTGGLRYSEFGFNDETVLSPRFNFSWRIDEKNLVNFNYGVYYQAPFYHEIRYLDENSASDLKSQRAIHYIAGWERTLRKDLMMQVEVYYKDLDNLIPFYYDNMKLEYIGGNKREGYAYGLDISIQGNLVEDMKSWITYSYLNSKDRDKESEEDYKRRILDQTHTIQVFLQDRIPKRPNWQAHTRFILGSGYLYHPRKVVTDDQDNSFIEVDLDNMEEFLFYFRVDMGLSASFKIGDSNELIAVAEVMNVFNNYNIAGYSWIQVFSDIKYPVKVPHIFSKRFFNLGVEFRF